MMERLSCGDVRQRRADQHQRGEGGFNNPNRDKNVTPTIRARPTLNPERPTNKCRSGIFAAMSANGGPININAVKAGLTTRIVTKMSLLQFGHAQRSTPNAQRINVDTISPARSQHL